MRTGAIAAVVAVLVAVVRVAAAEPSIDDAIARAAAQHQPLVIEFHASWCGPCKFFEARVLPSREVHRALAAVQFVRYDLDSPQGERAARRFGVTTVPTFLVLDRQGAVATRATGLAGGDTAGMIAWFVALVRGADADQDAAAALEERVRDHPDDGAARMRLADRYRASGRRLDAIAEYRVLSTATATTAGARARAATATQAYDELVAAEARLDGAVAAALAFVERFPDAPQATGQLALAIESERVPAATLDPLIARHAASTRDAVAAVRIALLAGYRERAAALAARVPDERTAQLLAAEVAADAGDAPRATRLVAEACRDAGVANARQCHLLESGLARGQRSPGVMRLRAVAAATLADLTGPGVGVTGLADLVDGDGFADAAAALLRGAGRACARGHGTTVSVAVRLADGGGPASLIAVYGDHDEALESCLRFELAQRSLPAAPAALDRALYEYVYVPARDAVDDRELTDDGRGRIDKRYRRSPPVGRGAMAYGLMRTGARLGIGVGATGFVDGGGLVDLRAVLGSELEGCLVTDGHGSYTARGYAGLGLRLERRITVTALAGFGASDDATAAALEVPVALRLEVDVGKRRAHVWTRGSYLLGDTPRQRSTGSAALGADEVALGAGLSLPTGGGRVFVGAVVESVTAGTSGSLLLGLPVGGWF